MHPFDEKYSCKRNNFARGEFYFMTMSIPKSLHRTFALFSFLYLVTSTLGFASAQDRDQLKPLPLRAEVAVQYQQSSATVRSGGDGTEVCVPWRTFENEPTGNADGGALHCHTRITHPIHLDVQVVGERVVLPITIGAEAAKIQSIVDTGSAGLTLNALQIFPPDLVTSQGFNFNGKDEIRYKGITVTKLTATRSYGGQSANPTSRTGNLGFAHIRLGEEGSVRTALIPILFVFTSTNKPDPTGVDFNNLLGINGALAPIGSQITYDGQPVQDNPAESAGPNAECTLRSNSACSLLSPLRAFSYDGGVQSGYIFHSLPLVNGQRGRYLTLGLNERDSKKFATSQLQCTTTSLEVQSCNQEVRNVHVVSSRGLDFYWNVIFDSGRPDIGIVVPTDSTGSFQPVTVPAGVTFTVTPPTQTGYQYTFITGTGVASTTRTYVDRNAANAAQTFSNMGLEFFATNSLLLDYDKGIEGWKPANDSQ